MKKIGVAILGLGVVGSGTYQILNEHREFYQKTQGVDIEIVSVLEKDKSRLESLSVPKEKIAANIAEVVGDPDVNIVVECMGGDTLAKEYVLAALSIGKSVVTSNKELYAKYSHELEHVAKRHNAGLFFGACIGSIPVVRLLLDGLTGDSICSVVGTAGDEMSAGYQLAVLSSLAFKAKVGDDKVKAEPLSSVSDEDCKAGHLLGYKLKLLFSGKKCDDGICVGVYPTLVKKTHPLGASANAVLLKGDNAGEITLSDSGANSLSYGSVIVSDVIYAATHIEIKYPTFSYEEKPFTEDDCSAYYLRFSANEAGAFSKITSALAKSHIDVVEMKECDAATIVLITTPARFSTLNSAVEKINASGLATVEAIVKAVY